MRHSLAWLGAAALVVLGLSGEANAQSGLKPYVVLILDTSGSMDASTGAGPPTCGGIDNRLNHARCAINEIANSYGDMVFALGRFRETPGGTYSTSCDANGDIDGFGGDQCTSIGVDCGNCSCNGRTTNCTTDPDCTAALRGDARAEMLTGLVDGNNDEAAAWTDFTCNTCGMTLANNPEIWGAGSWTPLTGSLLGARRYWQGLQATDGSTIWPAGNPGFDPIANDPLNDEFLPSGEQCRPYVTILLTDGDETCGGTPSTAAASLLATPEGAFTYRIETKPIGFGIVPGVNGDADIEAIAHAGGATDVAGAYEGYYASNQQELALAISTILSDTIRSETCNDADDDCDTFVDEDFPSLGMPCDDGLIGICRGTGVFECRGDGTGTQCNITNPGQPPGTEICNNLDDNCNGLIDEGLMCGGCGDAETCNNVDDDCDGATDEGLVRPCGTDVGQCTAGTEVCVAGDWENCTATGPFTEVCDGVDNDCDGTCDGFSRPCTDLGPPGNPNIGPCHDGIQVCPAVCGMGNSFGPCLGEVVPQTEVCNCVDDNCNGPVDEGTGGANCDTACGVGTTVCNPTTCALECSSVIVPGPELICDGVDDDCDMMIDEDYVPVACDDGGTLCNGMTVCMGGNEICVGDTISPEQCDCEDNDCDNMTDEMNGNCPAGATCTAACECAFPCDKDELLACPEGRTCVDGLCLTDPCFGIDCTGPGPNGEAQVCIDGTCEPACDHLQNPCPTGTVCFPSSGQCVFDDCRNFPERCTAEQICSAGTCVANPCFDVDCPSEQYCIGGQCTQSCGDVDCAVGTRCELGVCVPDPCAATPCGNGFVCDDATGTCVLNPCNGRTCPQGEVCNPDDGECIADPCTGVTCPNDDICRLGTCYDPTDLQPDAEGPEEHVTTGGGGGCSTGGDGAGAGVLLALVALATRRRRSRGSVPSKARPGLGLGVARTGCRAQRGISWGGRS